MVCFYVFIGFWILFVFRSDLYCIEFFIPFEIEVEIVLKCLQRMLNAIVAIELTSVASVLLMSLSILIFTPKDFSNPSINSSNDLSLK